MLTTGSNVGVFLIRNPMLRSLYETLTAGDVPVELKQLVLRDFEDYIGVLKRGEKLHFLTGVLWLVCGDDLDALRQAFEGKELQSDDRLSVEDKDSLVRALVFALGGISEEEVSGVMGMLEKYRKNDIGSNELPF